MVQNYNDTEKVLRKFIMSLKLLTYMPEIEPVEQVKK